MWVLAGLTAAVLYVVRGRRPREDAAAGTRTDRAVAPVLLLAGFAVAVSQTVVLAALPVLGRQLSVSATAATWLLTAFMLASAVATPIAGRLGDLYGHRRVLVAGLTALVAGSVLAAAGDHAGSFGAVLAGRVLQGLSGAVFPAAFGLARLAAPPTPGGAAPGRPSGLVAALSTMFGAGGAVGMVVAGPIVAGAGTAGLFWLGVALAAAPLAAVRWVPAGRPLESPAVGERRLDLAGAALLSATLVTLLLGIGQVRGPGWRAAAVLAACVAFGAAFVAVERRAAVPVVDLRLLRRPALVGTNITTVVIGIGLFAAVMLIPQYSQMPASTGFGFGDSPAEAGLLMVPTAVLMIVTAPVAARLARRVGGRATFQLGAALAAAALAGLAVAHQHRWQFWVAGAVVGAAYGLAFAALGTLVVGAAEPHETGAATGVNTILRTVGGALGAQLAAAVLAASTGPAGPLPTERGYVTAFLAAGGVALLAFLAALAIPASRPAGRPDLGG